MPSLLENLKTIRDGERNEQKGICGSLTTDQVIPFLWHAQRWPKCDRYFFSPVPYYFEHLDSGTLWKGEQLQLRLGLLDFVIGELEK